MKDIRDEKNRLYSCNRTVNTDIIKKLVERSSIRRGDTVYDIGAGTGIISRALLDAGARVIGIEKDPVSYRRCKAKFLTEDRFELFLDDFLQRAFRPKGAYKVFSNIPFNHTADIIGRLLFADNPPEDCYLIVQKEAAEKYAGIGGDTLRSLLLKPVFWVDIIHYFDRRDFFPVPGKDIVLLQFEKRGCLPFPAEDYRLYRDFVTACREVKDMTVKRSLGRFFTWPQLKQLGRLLGIDFRASPEVLTFRQWLGLFQFYRVFRR